MKRMMVDGASLTADDILKDSRYERGELWDGVFVFHEPSGGYHGETESNVNLILRSVPELRPLGRIRGASAGFVVARGPDRVLSPDASFMSFARCPVSPARGFVDGAPELAIEIRSPDDTWASVVAKGGVWIGHGAELVWCVDPVKRVVAVLRAGADVRMAGPDDRLSLAPIVEVDVAAAEIFDGLPEA